MQMIIPHSVNTIGMTGDFLVDTLLFCSVVIDIVGETVGDDVGVYNCNAFIG